MSRPGVEVSSIAAAPPVGVPTDTGVGFIVQEAERGPTDAPTRLTSLGQYEDVYGDRLATVPYGYDAVDAAFREGVTALYFQRLADNAKLATADAAAIAAGSTANAANPGAWGNDLKLDVIATPGYTKSTKKNGGEPERSPLLSYDAGLQAGPGAFMATVSYDGKIVQTSVPLDTIGELEAFVNSGDWISLTGGNPTDPVVAGSITLAAGDNGNSPASNDSLIAGLASMPKTLGPGNVAAPGRGAYADHAAILAHCEQTDRVCCLDGDVGSNMQTLITAAGLLRGAEQDRYGSLWGPWAVIPGIAPGTTRTVPWSAIQLGLMARNDRAGNPNQAAAGSWGISQYAIGLAQTFTDDEVEDGMYAGVNSAKQVYGSIQAYGFRSLVDPAGPRQEWLEFNWCRLNMAIVARSDQVGEGFTFAQIDGRGRTIAAFGGELGAVCKEFTDIGALYVEPGSDDPTTAYVVNTGPAVNTPETIHDGQMRAVLSVRMSPFAELVVIQIVKYPTTVSLA